MTNEHPITPPPEVVDRLFMIEGSEEDRIIAAYRAGADHELEACCAWVQWWDDLTAACQLRAARRPKPPSLKEQALEQCNDYIDPDGIIRRALERLPN